MGTVTLLQAGRWNAGFWSGFAAPNSWGVEKGTMFTAVMSGTVSEISGGKFANGAVTGAFVHLFNAKYDTLEKGLKGLWDKKYEILNDHWKGIKGFFKGMKDIEKIDLSKHPEAEAFTFLISNHRYQSDIAGTGSLKVLRLSKQFEPGTIYDTGSSIQETFKKTNEYFGQ